MTPRCLPSAPGSNRTWDSRFRNPLRPYSLTCDSGSNSCFHQPVLVSSAPLATRRFPVFRGPWRDHRGREHGLSEPYQECGVAPEIRCRIRVIHRGRDERSRRTCTWSESGDNVPVVDLEEQHNRASGDPRHQCSSAMSMSVPSRSQSDFGLVQDPGTVVRASPTWRETSCTAFFGKDSKDASGVENRLLWVDSKNTIGPGVPPP